MDERGFRKAKENKEFFNDNMDRKNSVSIRENSKIKPLNSRSKENQERLSYLIDPERTQRTK